MKNANIKIKTTDLGILDLDLPIINVGKGKIKVLIINNLHGNEITGFYVLQKLLEILSPKDIKCKVTIVSSANPLALLQKNRFTFIDPVDFNRNYPPLEKERGFNVAVKKRLISLGLEHDIIIDIHNFVRPSLSAGILIQQINKKNEKLVTKYLKILNMDIIIKINSDNREEKRVEKSLTAYLSSKGKIVLGFEYPPMNYINNNEITKFAEGLKKLLLLIPSVNKNKIIFKKIPIFKRQQIIAHETGLFVPAKNLNDSIKQGDILGYLINIKNLNKNKIVSEYQGKLIEIADKNFYLYGDKLATIGKQLKK